MSSVIVGGARTPMGRFLGALSGLQAEELGSAAIAGALRSAGVPPEAIDYVIMGQVLQAGRGQNPARPAAVGAGIPMNVPSVTINKVCLSGLNAVALADQLIRAGEAEAVVAGGMESMSNAPHLLPQSRTGTRYGDAALIDHLHHDGLWDRFTEQSMGALTESAAEDDWRFTRSEQDAFAARSHQRAAAATEAGRLAEEIVPVRLPGRRGAPERVVDTDEGIRPGTTEASLAGLRPAFHTEGTITAGSSSQISDGAAAVIVTSAEKAAEHDWPVLAHLGAHGMVAGPDSTLQGQPARAILAAAARDGIEPTAFDLYEINEAFAAVCLSTARMLGLTDDEVAKRFNVNGGAVALGHPIGMSGTRLVLTLAHELRRRGGGHGVAALCGGGGQGEALILNVPRS
jgi:acetyl-CoA C-acetyltransferase